MTTPTGSRHTAMRCAAALLGTAALVTGLSVAATPAAAFDETAPVWSVKVEIGTGTGDRSAARVDKQAYIRLSDSNITWLDSPIRDLPPQMYNDYELVLDGVRTIADIRRFELGLDSGIYKDVCVRNVKIWINGLAVVDQPYGTCRYLYADSEMEFRKPIVFSAASLRTAWADVVAPPPFLLAPYPLLADRLDTGVGHWAASNPSITRVGRVGWVSDGSFRFLDELVLRGVGNAVHVRSELDVLVRGAKRRVVVEQDVVITCLRGRVSIINANVTATGLAASSTVLTGLTDRVRLTIDASVRAAMRRVPPGTCPPLTVAVDGAVVLAP